MTDLLDLIYKEIDRVMPELKQIRNKLFSHPEVGGTEAESSALLISLLRSHGFAVTEDYYSIKYAFRAEVDSGLPGPTIGIFAEYDALPDIGHGCGHNLICSAALGAAFGLSSVLDKTGGKVVVYGTPGEENLETKSILAPQGAFDEADVGLMAHPASCSASSGTSRAIEALKIEFFGKTSHAGEAPELGINALDAAVSCYTKIAQRKSAYPGTNIHGIIRNGGTRANVIPDYCSLEFLDRADSMEVLSVLRELLNSCAAEAAASVGCTYKISNFEPTNAAMKTNRLLAAEFDRNLLKAGETSIGKPSCGGSTDMADVSYVIPAIHPYVGICAPLNLHTREFACATIEAGGDFFLDKASKALAGTGLKVLTDPSFLTLVKEEFNR